MRLSELLNEKLKPSQYRTLIKYFVRDRYINIFNDYKKSWQKNNYRIYIPFSSKQQQEQIKIPFDVEQYLKQKDIQITDYVMGIGRDKLGRNVKIGKYLNDNERLQKKFVNDPTRKASKHSNYYMVISRHPYDIGGMSTDRGWTSCMNLEGGSNRSKVVDDVEYGTLIAYCVREDDKNIENPLGRIRIHPYIKDENVIFGREYEEYGDVPTEFIKALDNWINTVNNKYSKNVYGIFRKPDYTYVDKADDIKTYNIHNIKKEDFIELNILEQTILLSKDFDYFKYFLTKEMIEYIITRTIDNHYFKQFKKENPDKVKEFVEIMYKLNVDDFYIKEFARSFGAGISLKEYGFKIKDFDELLDYISNVNYNALEIYEGKLTTQELFTLFSHYPMIIRQYTQEQKSEIINYDTKSFIFSIIQDRSAIIVENLYVEQQKILIDYIINEMSHLDDAIHLIRNMDDSIKNEYIIENPRIMKLFQNDNDIDKEIAYKSLVDNIDNIRYIPWNISNTAREIDEILDIIFKDKKTFKDVMNIMENNHYVSPWLLEHTRRSMSIIERYPFLAPYVYYYNYHYRKPIFNFINAEYNNYFPLVTFIDLNIDFIKEIKIDKVKNKYKYQFILDDNFYDLSTDINGLEMFDVYNFIKEKDILEVFV